MNATKEAEREILLDAMDMVDELAALLRALRNPRIEAYCLAHLEGRQGGWLGGNFLRDILAEELVALDGGEEAD